MFKPSPVFHAAIVHHMRVAGYDPRNSADAYVDHMFQLSVPLEQTLDLEEMHLQSLGLVDNRMVEPS